MHNQQAINGGADDATANTIADNFVASPTGQATIAAGVQNQVNTLIAQNVAAQLPVQANARATSKVDSISSLLSLDLRRTGLSEERLLDNRKATSFKRRLLVFISVHLKISLTNSHTNYRIGYGNSVYQGSERYALKKLYTTISQSRN
jgi:hypothetical protein